jgi:2',3'-cyclic-nucleotide 2'-phosphodiesterase (5'-nucleotidase family)
VNSDQLYRYVGNLIVGFDEHGVIDFVDKRSGPIATTKSGVEQLGRELGRELELSTEVRQIWDALQATPIVQTQFEVAGTTDEPLIGQRSEVRSRETNLGRLVADSTLWYAQEFIDANNVNIDDVDIALKNGGGIRDNILGPNVTRFTIGAALAFDNNLAIVELTAKELLATMENSISRVPSLDGRFPQVAGIYMEFDANRAGVSDRVTMVTPSRVGTLVVHRSNGTTDTVVQNFELVGDPNRTFRAPDLEWW